MLTKEQMNKIKFEFGSRAAEFPLVCYEINKENPIVMQLIKLLKKVE